MYDNTLSRRKLVQGLGLGGASFFLPTLRQARAASTPPRRIITFYSQHGTLPWLWMPASGGRTDFELGYLLSPLQAYKKDLILLNGIDFKALDFPGGRKGTDGHATGQASSMTANVQINDETKGDTASRGQGPSFDYWLARQLEKKNGGQSPTPFPEQRVRIYNTLPTNPNWGRPYQDDQNKWLIPTARASDVYNRLFGAAMNPGPGADATTARRKSALDLAMGEFQAVGARLGKYERERLQQHAALVSDLSKQLVTTPGMPGATCARPAAPPAAMGGAGANWKLTSDAIPKLVQAALACDLTRVIAIQVEEPDPGVYGGINPSAIGGIDNLHDLVHAIDVNRKDGQDAARLATAKGFYLANAKLFASLLDLLASVKESDGQRLLDHTAVLWCGEIAQPGHSTNNHKWLIAGSCGGALKTGQSMNYDGDAVNWSGMRSNVPSNGDVFTTLARAMGVNDMFGPAGATSGPIPGLLV